MKKQLVRDMALILLGMGITALGGLIIVVALVVIIPVYGSTAAPPPTTVPTLTPVIGQQPPATSMPSPNPDAVDRTLRVPILMYHYISTPPEDADIYREDLSVAPEDFRAQMQWLAANGYTAISLYELHEALTTGVPLPAQPVVLTFDDGYVDNYENAFPLLQEFGFEATFFILTDVTDRSQPGYMTWDMLHEMHRVGMDIEVHGREHFDMTGRDNDWLYFHTIGPAETIEYQLGYRPRFIAYPSGRYDELVLEKMPEYGYWMGLSTRHGYTHSRDEMYIVERIRVRGDWDLATFIDVMTDIE